MEIIKDSILKKEISFTEKDLKLAIINHVNSIFPDFLDKDDDFKGISNDVANFEYDPFKPTH